MKRLHRVELYGWSRFDEARNIDFQSVLWRRAEGNVLVDPLPMSEHDALHLRDLGGASLVIVTNSDHLRDALAVAELTGAVLAGPAEERGVLPSAFTAWLADGDEPVPGLRVMTMDGSKTPGELALIVQGHTLITGDLVRAHAGGALDLLPDGKLVDRRSALDSLARLVAVETIDAVLPGDGWPVFRNGHAALAELLRRSESS